jgi:hypothetical protein
MLGQDLCRSDAGRRWQGEPRVEELLDDPMMRMVMHRDRVHRDDLARLIEEVRESLRHG